MAQIISLIGIGKQKFYDWKRRYNQPNNHNGKMPRSFWLMESEKQAVIDFADKNPDQGYRRLSYMMLDEDVAAVSPTTAWRVLKEAGKLGRWNKSQSQKGTGFKQPSKPHKHWYIDVSYINIRGTFYYLCSVLDGFSRSIVAWDIRTEMKEADVEIILQRARETHPKTKPRVISDNGPQFLAKDFKEFIRISGMTHVRTSTYYPQSNGKIERWHKSIKQECIRPRTPLSLEEAKRFVGEYVAHYNTVRLHSAIGYVTPDDMLNGRQEQVIAARNLKLDAARCERRAQHHLKQQTDAA